jgi:multiple sugar transport system substrate-binding protein
MRRYRSLHTFLLTCILALPSACSTSPPLIPPPGSVVVTFACMDYQRDQYNELVKDFQKANPDIYVQFVSADEASGIQQQGNTLTSSGSEIEELAAAADTFVWFARMSPGDWPYLLNLQPFIQDDEGFPADDFYPNTLDDLRWQGDLHGLPAEILPIVIFYDKKMFDENGVDYPETGWGWDDFLKAADQLTERGEDEVVRYGFVDAHFNGTILAMLHGHGVRLWDDHADPPRPLFDRPEVADIVQHYVDLALTYEVMPMPEVGSNVMASNLVNGEKAAMWTAFFFDYDYHAQRTDVGLVPFPEDEAAANPRSMYGFFASAGTEHPEAVWRWLTYLSEHYQPLDGSLPGRRSVGERMHWWQRLDRGAKSVVEYALAHPTSPENPLNLPLRQAIREVIQGESGVEEALATAQTRALELQAELAAAEPEAPQPVARPQPTPAGVGTVITFAAPPGSDQAVYRGLAAAFHEAHSKIWVDVVAASYDPTAMVETSDCFAGDARLVHYPEVRQRILSLEPLMEEGPRLDQADFYPALLEAVQYGGKWWGLPYEADALMAYYNGDRFTEAGVARPEPGWRFDDFLAAAVSLTDGDRYGFTTREGAYGDLIFALERLGARLLDCAGETPAPTFDDPTVVAALARYAEASRRGALSPRTPSQQSGWPDAMMSGGHPARVEDGHVAMWIDYISTHHFAPPLPFEVGVVPLPVGAESSTEFAVSAYFVSAHTDEPQACWEWLAFLSEQAEVATTLPARRSVAASLGWRDRWDEAALSAYQAALEYAHTSIFNLRWDPHWMAYTYPWLDEAFQAVVAGGDAAQALAKAQQKAEKYVGCLEDTDGSDSNEALPVCAREVDPDYPLPGN